MRHLPRCAWWHLSAGSVVLLGAAAVTVNDVVLTWANGGVARVVLHAEGLPPIDVTGTYAQPVEFDDTDAVGNMLHAGFTVTPITQE